MPIWVWVLISTWLLCGLWGYGLSKAVSRDILDTFQKMPRYDWPSEFNLWLGIPLGPIALFAWISRIKTGVCFRMPKELCRR